MSPRSLLTLAGLALCPVARSQTYSVHQLPPPPGYATGYAYGINDAGTVVGQVGNGAQRGPATVWVSGQPQVLPSLPDLSNAMARDINNAGQIVGQCYTSSDANAVPCIWEHQQVVQLPVLPGAKPFGQAWQINDAGIITGRTYAAGQQNTQPVPCIWQRVNGVWTLKVLPYQAPGSSQGAWAFGINASGTATGMLFLGFPHFQAATWSGGVLNPLVFGPANAVSTEAWGIDTRGRITGSYLDAIDHRGYALLLDGQSTTDLGNLSGYAHLLPYRLTDSGTVLGWTYNGQYELGLDDLSGLGFIWRSGSLSAMDDILTNGAGWHIRQLWDFNAAGQVAGIGELSGGLNYRAVMLTPCPANCDNSLSAPVLNVQDFACFLNKFAAGDTYANCDGSSTPPVLNVLDFSCFVNHFAAGCP